MFYCIEYIQVYYVVECTLAQRVWMMYTKGLDVCAANSSPLLCKWKSVGRRELKDPSHDACFDTTPL